MPHDPQPAAPSPPAPPQFAAGPQQATLLLTDLVGSTQLTRQLGDAAAASLWRQHDHLSLQLLRTWGGRKIDQSDGLLLLFPQPAAALAFALAYHRALAALQPPLQARVGIHHGAVDLRVASPEDIAYGAKPLEVDGLAKPVAGRIMALAQGGQTLLSEATGQALAATAATAANAATAPPTWCLRPQGHWRFKGLDEPIALLEALPADDPAASDTPAPCTPPPPTGHDKAYRVVWRDGLWHPVDEQRHNLPAERDRFIGRDGPLRELARHLDEGHRLVSLLGPGGTGKTRVALRHARAWRGEFPGGAWWCDLSAARSLDGLLHAVAQGLELPLGKGAPVPQIGQALASRGRALVVLDNFEQVVTHAEATLGAWLDQAPDTCFLVTSRERLQVRGELCVWLEPMGDDEALRMFHARAGQVSEPMASAQSSDLLQLMRLLDGLPLAIELAAARAEAVPVAQMLATMQNQWSALARPASAAGSQRQATLEATIAWSWDLLDPAEQVALVQLTVFDGGWALEAAAAVLQADPPGSGPGHPGTLALLERLTNRCLVRRPRDGRWDLLPTLRAFAEQRRLGGQVLDAQAWWGCLDRHAGHYAAVTEASLVQGRFRDAGNVIAACQHRIAQHRADPQTVDKLGPALEAAWLVLHRRGPLQLGAQLAEQVWQARPPSAPPLPPDLQHSLHWVAGSAWLASGQGPSAQPLLLEATRLARAARRPERMAMGLAKLALVVQHSQPDEALRRARCALRLAQRAGDAEAICLTASALGGIHWAAGRAEPALAAFQAGLSVAGQLPVPRWRAGLLNNVALVQHQTGQPEPARLSYQEGIELADQCGERRWAASARCNLGLLLAEQQALDTAEPILQQAIDDARALGDQQTLGVALCNFGILLRLKGEVQRALEMLEVAAIVTKGSGEKSLIRIISTELHNTIRMGSH